MFHALALDASLGERGAPRGERGQSCGAACARHQSGGGGIATRRSGSRHRARPPFVIGRRRPRVWREARGVVAIAEPTRRRDVAARLRLFAVHRDRGAADGSSETASCARCNDRVPPRAIDGTRTDRRVRRARRARSPDVFGRARRADGELLHARPRSRDHRAGREPERLRPGRAGVRAGALLAGAALFVRPRPVF